MLPKALIIVSVLLCWDQHIVSGQVSPNVKNVLMIIVDDFRPEISVYTDTDNALYPGIQTPNIETLAQRSFVFTRAHCQFSLCGPSRTSFLTGRRPDSTRVYNNDGYWRITGGNFTTIPQYFNENGYSTFSGGKVFHSEDCDNEYSWSEDCYLSTNDGYWNRDGLSWGIAEPEEYEETPLPCMQVRDFAIEKLREVATNADPFFIAIGLKKPHLPFKAPRKFYEMYPEEDINLPVNMYVPDNLPEIAWSGRGDLQGYDDINVFNNSYNETLPISKTIELRRGYYASVSYMDSLVGEILQELTVQNLENSTAVLLLGDHGFHLGEHADWAKKTNFELDTRVPMMLKIPGTTDDGQVINEYVELVDVFPTLVDIVGLESITRCRGNSTETPVCHEGRSIVRSIERNEWKDAVFSQIKRNKDMGHTIHTKEYSYSRWMRLVDDEVDWDRVTAEELYDLMTDPDQTENVAGYPEYSAMQSEAADRLLAGWRGALL